MLRPPAAPVTVKVKHRANAAKAQLCLLAAPHAGQPMPAVNSTKPCTNKFVTSASAKSPGVHRLLAAGQDAHGTQHRLNTSQALLANTSTRRNTNSPVEQQRATRNESSAACFAPALAACCAGSFLPLVSRRHCPPLLCSRMLVGRRDTASGVLGWHVVA